MAKVQNPTLFSKYFNISANVITGAGLIDPFIDVDTPLFIDPILLAKSSNQKIKTDGIDAFRNHFQAFVRLLKISKKEGDPAWKAAQRHLDLAEPPENGLGYGGSGTSGSSRPAEIRDAILKTAKDIIDLGASDPEMVSLMGFFEEGVGPDTISDFTTRAISKQLCEITADFCADNKIKIYTNDTHPDHKLPKVITPGGKTKYIILVPIDIVRDLPIARDWSDISSAAFQNAQIRDRVNTLLGGIAQPTIADIKDALRSAALSSPGAFDAFLAAVKAFADNYDPNSDALGYYKMKKIFSEGMPELKLDNKFDISVSPDALFEFVLESIKPFKHHIENGNLWEELWIGSKPKRERASQLIYFAMADAFCKANNVDISPEASMGGGPVDFKFSQGYNARVLVELKRSSGTVVHGYEKQLEIYKAASQTEYGIFVVIDYGDGGNKISDIREIRRERLARGERASEILVIDARKKASASKRK